MRSMTMRAALAAAALAASAGIASAQGLGTPGEPTPDSKPGAGDRVNAAIVARELRAMSLPAEVSADSGGEPRIETTVDRFKWTILFHGCDKDGALEQRSCISIQFFSGYTLKNPVSTLTMNKFNSENRYTRAYTATTAQGPAARISMDVMFGGTGAEPGRQFRATFAMMKYQTAQFRKLINFS